MRITFLASRREQPLFEIGGRRLLVNTGIRPFPASFWPSLAEKTREQMGWRCVDGRAWPPLAFCRRGATVQEKGTMVFVWATFGLRAACQIQAIAAGRFAGNPAGAGGRNED
jgi:hypothetical protein